MKPSARFLLLTTVLTLCGTNLNSSQIDISLESDPMAARVDARKIAVKFRDRGYRITPVANGDNLTSFTQFDLNLTKGTDCVIMVGIDSAMPDVDLYVKDDVGNMIRADTRTINRACVEFSASYNGDYTVVVKPTASDPVGHFAVLIGVQPSGYQ
ncbi:MAG: hypothetical protein B7Z37_21350 [Verrucomicrobia bacterium 12-59-8]|nr:MAG: hypothetical protein B7Z37_21350 [Verrucomicrobia bacterium 12-59-8]